MFRSRKSAFVVVAGLIVAALITLAPAREAAANGAMGKSPVDHYYVTIYYRASAHDPWHPYYTYYASVHANGAIDWGGAIQAVQVIRAYGYEVFYTTRYAGRTYE